MPSNQVLSEVEYNVVGKRPVRPDGVDKVTGRARYGADTNLTGTLQAKVLRSPFPHAWIKSIDTSKAEAFPGVRAVVTAKDLPFASLFKDGLGNEYTALKYASDHLLASGKVLFKGHPVAAVAAVNAHVAESALALIQIDYEELASVVDVREAMKDGAPLVHEDLRTNDMGETADKPSNIATHRVTQRATSIRDSPKLTSCWSGNTPPPPCTKVTSNPTIPPPFGTPTGN